MSRFNWAASCVIVISLTGFVLASESDELRERAHAIRREAAELHERGHIDEAENLERKANEILAQAEHLKNERSNPSVDQIRELERRLDALYQEERKLVTRGNEKAADRVRHEAQQIKRELHDIHSHRNGPNPAPQEEIARRLEHMRAAIEHLHHAGLHDVADHVAERAKATERELQEHQRHPEMIHQIMGQLEELRREVVGLREDVNELREKR